MGLVVGDRTGGFTCERALSGLEFLGTQVAFVLDI